MVAWHRWRLPWHRYVVSFFDRQAATAWWRNEANLKRHDIHNSACNSHRRCRAQAALRHGAVENTKSWTYSLQKKLLPANAIWSQPASWHLCLSSYLLLATGCHFVLNYWSFFKQCSGNVRVTRWGRARPLVEVGYVWEVPLSPSVCRFDPKTVRTYVLRMCVLCTFWSVFTMPVRV